jgi:predicted transcriptional regulator
MTTQRLTIELPEPIFQQLARIAAATQQSLESLVTQSIASNLPPSADNAPPEMQAELLQMQTLEVPTLLEIAQGLVSPIHQFRHNELLEKNQIGSLTPDERQELNQLRQTVDRFMLKKAYAWSVLRWKGYRVPPLNELPLE